MNVLGIARNFVAPIKRVLNRPIPKRKTKNSYGSNLDNFNSYLLNTKFSRPPFDDLKFYRYHDPMVNTGINLLTQAILGTGNFVSPGPSYSEESQLCHKIITNRNFKAESKRAVSDALGYGDGYVELIWANNQIVDYAYIASSTIEAKTDDKGIIIRYEQTINNIGEQPIVLMPYQILHISFWHIEDSIQGIGLIEPILHRLYSKRSSERSTDEAMAKYANPSIHGVLKDAEEKDMKEFHEDLSNFKRTSVITTSENAEISIIGEKKNFPDFSPLVNNIIDSISGGLRVPRETLIPSGKDLNRSSLEFLVKQNEKEIIQLQQDLSTIIEKQLFTVACLRRNLYNIPDLGWNVLNIENEKDRAEINNFVINTLSEAVTNGLISREEGSALAKSALRIKDQNI